MKGKGRRVYEPPKFGNLITKQRTMEDNIQRAAVK